MLKLLARTFVLLTVMVASDLSASEYLDNASFEEMDEKGMPCGWNAGVWGAERLDVASIWGIMEQPGVPLGARAARVVATGRHFSTLAQEMKNLTPGRWYEVTAMIRCEQLDGHGAFIAVESQKKDGTDNGSGCVSSPNMIGTSDWTTASVRFLAPGNDYRCVVSCYQAGGPGTSLFDNIVVRPIERPTFDNSKRRVLDGPFWGMFTCWPNYLHQYGQEMKSAGVYWQRMGTAALHPDQRDVAQKLGMAYAVCLDGMPNPDDKTDPCYPVTSSAVYRKWLAKCVQDANPTVRTWEVFNEPNTNLEWNLRGYTNLLKLVGKVIRQERPGDLAATGGFAAYQAGYVAAVLRDGAGESIDMVMLHPYVIDEPLDCLLYAVGDACAAYGRPDMAIAINETGWPTYDPATGLEDHKTFVSEAEQAANIVKLYVQGLSHKLSLVCLLGWNDFQTSDHSRNMGLVRVDGTKKPAFHAFAFMTRTIGDRRIAGWSYEDNGTRVYKLGKDKPVWVVWNALQDAEVTVDVGANDVFLRDIYGTRLTASPQRGDIIVKATREPKYLDSANTTVPTPTELLR